MILRDKRNIGKTVVYIKGHPREGRIVKITGFRGDWGVKDGKLIPNVTLSDGNSCPGFVLKEIKKGNKMVISHSRMKKEVLIDKMLSQDKFKKQLKSLTKLINLELNKWVKEDPNKISWMEISDGVVDAIGDAIDGKGEIDKECNIKDCEWIDRENNNKWVCAIDLDEVEIPDYCPYFGFSCKISSFRRALEKGK